MGEVYKQKNSNKDCSGQNEKLYASEWACFGRKTRKVLCIWLQFKFWCSFVFVWSLCLRITYVQKRKCLCLCSQIEKAAGTRRRLLYDGNEPKRGNSAGTTSKNERTSKTVQREERGRETRIGATETGATVEVRDLCCVLHTVVPVCPKCDVSRFWGQLYFLTCVFGPISQGPVWRTEVYAFKANARSGRARANGAACLERRACTERKDGRADVCWPVVRWHDGKGNILFDRQNQCLLKWFLFFLQYFVVNNCACTVHVILFQARREEAETQRQKSANFETLGILQKQRASLEARKQEERRLQQEEATLMVSQLFFFFFCSRICFAEQDYVSFFLWTAIDLWHLEASFCREETVAQRHQEKRRVFIQNLLSETRPFCNRSSCFRRSKSSCASWRSRKLVKISTAARRKPATCSTTRCAWRWKERLAKNKNNSHSTWNFSRKFWRHPEQRLEKWLKERWVLTYLISDFLDVARRVLSLEGFTFVCCALLQNEGFVANRESSKKKINDTGLT